MTTTRSCILTHGARTPVGLRADTSAAAVRAGICRLAAHPRFYDADGEPFVVGMDRTLDAHDPRERMLALAASALDECLAPLDVDPKAVIPILVGIRETALGFGEDDAAWLAHELAQHASQHCRVKVMTIASGNSAGLLALHHARKAVEDNAAPLVIAGGVDSHIAPAFLERLDEKGRYRSVVNRWGYPPGEGAGMLAICSLRTAQRLGRTPLAGLVGSGEANEAAHLGSDGVCTGVGLTEAIRDSLGSLAWPREHIAATYCDLNGEFHRNEEFMYATQRLPAGAFRAIEEFTAPADCWGDVGAASGPLFATLAIEAGRRRYAKGPHALLWAASDNGQRAAALLNTPTEDSL